MEIVGYLASLCIGIALGMLGGGGSILTVPVLVYLFQVSPLAATTYSLGIVGITSIAAATKKFKARQVNFRIAILFGLPSTIAVLMVRRLVLPVIPESIHIASYSIPRDKALMVLFAIVMLLASISMMRKPNNTSLATNASLNTKAIGLLLLQGFAEGTLTGLVGAGGGFLIIPALVLISKLPMPTAVGTSLLIIGVKSLIGFGASISNTGLNIALFLGIVTSAIIGMLLGVQWSKQVPAQSLKRAFGVFVLLMALLILYQEFVA
ncbi:MAG: sulfite exporter TauE/SafE family protein [Chitinophagaceae bacterium]